LEGGGLWGTRPELPFFIATKGRRLERKGREKESEGTDGKSHNGVETCRRKRERGGGSGWCVYFG